jgi:hypothetical protein
MTTSGIDPQRERFWRRLSNWLWLTPLVWWGLSRIYQALTEDTATVLSLVLVPWWVLLTGILGYTAMLIQARWGTPVCIALLLGGGIAGGLSWMTAGIHAALSCGLVAPLILGGGLLRIPLMAPGGLPVRILAAVLGIAEPFLVITAAIAITFLTIHLFWMELPAAWLWWVLAPSSLLILGCSWWFCRSWSRAGNNHPQPTTTETAI